MTEFDARFAAEGDGIVAAVLALVVAAGMLRIAVRQWRASPPCRAHPLRIALLLLAQPVGAALLYLTLFPPPRESGEGTLVVATAETTPAAWAAATGEVRVALPEAPAVADARRVPDLATALRRYPNTRRIHVVGAGLEARDLDAAAQRVVAFDAPPLPRGLVALDGPDAVVAGAGFRVSGRVHGVAGGAVELLDPAARRVDRAPLSGDGRFTLGGITRAPGSATFALRIVDARQRLVESVALPMRVDAAEAPRVLVLAGAPGPEVKFLRRWARDAGLVLHTQIEAGAGMQLGDAPLRLDAGTLARFDAVVLDERAWSGLGDAQRAALTEAVHGGLGMILRVTAVLDDAQRRRLRSLGFAVDAGREDEPVRLQPPRRDEQAVRARLGPGTRDAPRMQDDPLPDVPMLTRRSLRIAAPDAMQLDSAAAGIAPATWRAEGRGRIAVWTLTDTYALVLAGRDDLHAALWSDGLATIARPRASRAFRIEGERRQGQRIALCGLAGASSVTGPGGADVPLRVDPSTGERACAAFWPQQAGWHLLQSDRRRQAFHVRGERDAPGLHAARLRDGTSMLLARGIGAPGGTAAGELVERGARWPWFLGFLLAAALTWWLERSRRGRRVAQADPER